MSQLYRKWQGYFFSYVNHSVQNTVTERLYWESRRLHRGNTLTPAFEGRGEPYQRTAVNHGSAQIFSHSDLCMKMAYYVIYLGMSSTLRLEFTAVTVIFSKYRALGMMPSLKSLTTEGTSSSETLVPVCQTIRPRVTEAWNENLYCECVLVQSELPVTFTQK